MLYLRRVRGLRLLFLVFSVCAVPAAHGQTCGWGDYYFVLAVDWVHPLTGKPVLALCGKLWIPGRDPQKFPVCPTCKEIYEKLKD